MTHIVAGNTAFNRRLPAVACAALFASLPTRLAASGTLPPIPRPTVRFATFEACVASLERAYLDQLGQLDTRPVPMAAGSTRQRMLDTDGIRQPRPHRAEYRAQLGTEFRRVVDAAGTIESNFSYETVHCVCAGRVRRGETGGGFYLPGYQSPAPRAVPISSRP